MEVSANGGDVTKALTSAGLPQHLTVTLAGLAPDADAAIRAWKSIDLKMRLLTFGLFAFSCIGVWLLAKSIVRDQVLVCVNSPVTAFLVQLLLQMIASVCAASWIVGLATQKSPLDVQCQRLVGSFLSKSDAETARRALRIHKRFGDMQQESAETFVRKYTSGYLPVLIGLTVAFVIAAT
ncbi:MAG: hypothetical protein R3C08_09620, partial [Hyphomonas sp.]